MLYRRKPEQGRARFFSLMIECDLFGTIRLVRNWGLVGSKGQEEPRSFLMKPRSRTDAQRQKGYADL